MVGPARRIVTGPAPQPLPFGLLSAAVVIDDDDPHLYGGVTYETLTCGVAHLTEQACFDGAATDPAPDDLTVDDGVPYTHGDTFPVYALHQCRLIGGGWDDAKRVAGAKLAAGESRAVELGFANANLYQTGSGAPDLTPTAGTALLPIEAVALVEEWAADHYSGVPTLHAARSTGTILTNRAGVGAESRNGRLTTGLGSVVAAGAGYHAASEAAIDGVTPGAGERWLFVTGTVVVRRGPVTFTDPIRVTTAGAPLNEFAILATRAVNVTAECILGRILVQSPSGVS